MKNENFKIIPPYILLDARVGKSNTNGSQLPYRETENESFRASHKQGRSRVQNPQGGIFLAARWNLMSAFFRFRSL